MHKVNTTMRKMLLFAPLLAGTIALAGCQEEPVADLPDADLGGTLWTLQSLDVPGSPALLPDVAKIFSIQFFEDYHFEGDIDCNLLDGEYMLFRGDSIRFKDVRSTRINCRESSNSLAQQYQTGISAVHSYKITGNRLQLFFDDSVLKYRNLE